jgi:hypothetical protein
VNEEALANLGGGGAVAPETEQKATSVVLHLLPHAIVVSSAHFTFILPSYYYGFNEKINKDLMFV